MPVLDAKALKADPDGLAFLRDVLRPAGAGAERPVSPLSAFARPRPKSVKAGPSALPAETPRAP
jgi:hypothetical protein